MNRLSLGGVDTSKLLVIQSPIQEEVYETLWKTIDQYKSYKPEGKLFIVFDSIGNMTNKRDVEMDMTKDSLGVGSKSKINRFAMEKLKSIMNGKQGLQLCVLMINYTYDSMGFGVSTKVISGGKGLSQHSSLAYTLGRKNWVEKVENGEKVRKGLVTIFKLVKNHVSIGVANPPKVEVEITSAGFKVVGKE